MSKDDFTAKRIEEARALFNNDEAWPLSYIDYLSDLICKNFLDNQKVAFVGNGGSAAEAMHLAAEFTGKCVVPHDPWPAFALNESQSSITAIANDFGVEFIFSRQVEAHLKKNDILIALSTSGKSPNIIKALEVAVQLGVQCFLWTGAEKPMIDGVKVWSVPSLSTPRIQEIHLVWGHLIAETVESRLRLGKFKQEMT